MCTLKTRFFRSPRLVLPAELPYHFMVSSHLKSESPLGGFLFAILDSSDTVIQLGVYMHPVNNFKQNITVYYSNTRRNIPIAEFVIDDLTGSWIWWVSYVVFVIIVSIFVVAVTVNYNSSSPCHVSRLSLKLHADELTLFINCKNVSTARVIRSPGGLTLDMVSTLFVGQGGPVLNGHFVVSNMNCFW